MQSTHRLIAVALLDRRRVTRLGPRRLPLAAALVGSTLTLACGGGAPESTRPSAAVSGGDEAARPATSVGPSLPLPVPLEEMRPQVRAAWAILDELNTDSRAALLEAATADDCSVPLSRWHAASLEALLEIETVLEGDLALTIARSAPPHWL